MGFLFLSDKWKVLPAVLAALALGSTVAYPAPQGEKILFSDPSAPSPVVVSNLNHLDPSQSGLKQAEEQMFKPFLDSLKNQGSGPPNGEGPRPQIQRVLTPGQVKQIREFMDRKKNWVFSDFNELFPDSSAEKALGVKDYDGLGREQKALSMIQKYLETQNTKSPGTNAGADLSEFSFTNGLSRMGQWYPGADELSFGRGKNMFAPPNQIDDLTKTLNTVGRFGEASDQEDAKAAQKRFDEFKQLLDPPRAHEQNGDSLAQKLLNQQLRDPAAGQSDQHRSVYLPFANPSDSINRAARSTAFGDPTYTALGMPPPTQAPLPPTQAKVVQSIQQMIDPYGSILKPKF